jgi:hypothetical protein
MKLSSFLVSLVLVGVFASVFGLFYVGISDTYDRDFDNSTFSGYNKISNISAQAETIKSGIDTDDTEVTLTDLIGGFLKKGFAVLTITYQSFDLFTDMAGDAGDQLNERSGGAISGLFTPALITIAIILLVFIIISILVGREV